MKRNASVVIVGGGIVGCCIAYSLAREGIKDVVLLERGTLSGGATGRCGAGVRQQWGTAQNCLLARESMRVFENLPDVLGMDCDIELKQKGYLLLAYSGKEMQQFEKNLQVQHALDIPSRLLTPQEARDIVPMLNIEHLAGAAFCPTDGHANPFLTTLAFADAARNLGVEIHQGVEVRAIQQQNGRVSGVTTDKGSIETPVVINAAGGWSHEIGEMAGLDLPVFSERHEILVTEPVNPILDPMVMSFSYNIYCQQTPHGSFIMGHGPENEPPGHNQESSWQFLESMAKKATWLLPPLAKLRIVRQWAGSYNMSPDRQPIVCASEQLEGFFMAIGFSGHGFMLGPAIGTLMADLVLRRPLTWDVTLDLGRFSRQEIISEPSVV
ncbi:MAG TPA: FAD-binding oxidoreductase [Thermotogota bacterium]|nr:FAD-binding oxidoreductase [Thermotogota bacterium]HRW92867.1 FAD-binding oxidoreductase [Thermotogota bacterium]